MALLCTGIFLWIGIHLVPTLGQNLRAALVNRFGIVAFRTLFVLIILAALTLIVIGWRAAAPVSIYLPAAELRPVAIGLAVIAFVLLGATGRRSRIGRLLRFPQLAAVVLWAIAHLLANGDNRSLTLFSGAIVWALVMMVLISRRDGPWQKPKAPPWTEELLWLGATGLAILAVVFLHPWFAGVPIY